MAQSPHDDGFVSIGAALEQSVQTRSETCPDHGEFVSRNMFRNVWSICPKCRDEGEERLRERERRDAEERTRKAEAQQLRYRLHCSGLVGRFLDATFANFETPTPAHEAALKACRDYVAKLGGDAAGGLWLIGPPGTGKTHLGSAMVNAMIREKQLQARIHSAREIVRMLRATWRKHEPRAWEDDAPEFRTEDEAIEGLGNTPLLVLDEIGVGFGSDSEMVQLFDVLDLRYKLGRPTVLLSNLDIKDLKPALGDRAYDRLREGSTVVRCRWESRRSSGSRS